MCRRLTICRNLRRMPLALWQRTSTGAVQHLLKTKHIEHHLATPSAPPLAQQRARYQLATTRDRRREKTVTSPDRTTTISAPALNLKQRWRQLSCWGAYRGVRRRRGA